MLRGLLTMNTDELERFSVIQKIVDKSLTQDFITDINEVCFKAHRLS